MADWPRTYDRIVSLILGPVAMMFTPQDNFYFLRNNPFYAETVEQNKDMPGSLEGWGNYISNPQLSPG